VKKIIAKTSLVSKFLQNFCIRIMQKILLKNFSFKNFSRWFFLGIAIAFLILSLDLLTKKIIFNLIDRNLQIQQNSAMFDMLDEGNELKIFSFFLAL
jgi:hypothetical protein